LEIKGSVDPGIFLVALSPGDFPGGSILGEQMAKPILLRAGFICFMGSVHSLGRKVLEVRGNSKLLAM